MIINNIKTMNSQTNSDWWITFYNGVWQKNPALIQLLGLCPLLAVSTMFVNALGLALATIFVIVLSNMSVSLVRSIVADNIRLPVFVMIIACFTTCIELIMQAFAFDLYKIIGLFVPLIVTNCMILGRAEAFARNNPVGLSIWDGFSVGLGFGLILVLLGTVRELLGSGAIFANMHLLIGGNVNWQITIWQTEQNLLIAILPAGAFIIVGLFIALFNIINQKMIDIQKNKHAIAVGSKRIRTTGEIK